MGLLVIIVFYEASASTIPISKWQLEFQVNTSQNRDSRDTKILEKRLFGPNNDMKSDFTRMGFEVCVTPQVRIMQASCGPVKSFGDPLCLSMLKTRSIVYTYSGKILLLYWSRQIMLLTKKESCKYTCVAPGMTILRPMYAYWYILVQAYLQVTILTCTCFIATYNRVENFPMAAWYLHHHGKSVQLVCESSPVRGTAWRASG